MIHVTLYSYSSLNVEGSHATVLKCIICWRFYDSNYMFGRYKYTPNIVNNIWESDNLIIHFPENHIEDRLWLIKMKLK